MSRQDQEETSDSAGGVHLRSPKAPTMGIGIIALLLLLAAARLTSAFVQGDVPFVVFGAAATTLAVFVVARLAFWAGIVTTPDEIIVRDVLRPVRLRRDEVIDFGHQPIGERVWQSTGAGVAILSTSGEAIRTIVIGENGAYAVSAARELVAWYLRERSDSEWVDEAMGRKGTISGRPVPFAFYHDSYHRRLAGMDAALLAVTVFGFVFGVLALRVDESLALSSRGVLSSLMAAGFWVWLYVDLVKPKLVLDENTLEVINRFTEPVVIPRAEIAEVDLGDELVIVKRDGERVPVHMGKKRWWNLRLKWRARTEKDLEVWLDGPGEPDPGPPAVPPRHFRQTRQKGDPLNPMNRRVVR